MSARSRGQRSNGNAPRRLRGSRFPWLERFYGLRVGKDRRPMFDYLIVGAGFAGSVLAERLARQAGKRVLLVDRRPHIGGNAYDHYDDAGILVHRYGPHIFHTNSERVVEYLSQFTDWRPYEERGRASVHGPPPPLPLQ